jgi:hypothetical protein
MNIRSLFVYFVLFFIPFHVLHAEEIVSFNAEYDIQKNGRVHVTEHIRYDFGSEERRGIFRTIPTIKRNEQGKEFRIEIDQFSVVDRTNTAYEFSIEKSHEETELKIGDADKIITGVHDYIISYVVAGGLTYFSDHDEFYWNVTGNGWDVPIRTTTARLKLPGLVDTNALQFACFTGPSGSSEQNCSIDANTLTINNFSLLSGEGMTIVFGFPKGLVDVLEPQEVKTIFDNPLAVLGMLIAAFCWYIVGILKVL